MLRAARKKKISSRFLCPCPPLLLSAPNQNCHATQANHNYAPQHCIFHKVSTIIVGGALRKENLLLPSWVRHRREGSAWIVWSFWSHGSPNFGTIPSCSLSSNWFSKCDKPMAMTSSLLDHVQGYQTWVQNRILAHTQQRFYLTHAESF